jgi:hypothetical protein
MSAVSGRSLLSCTKLMTAGLREMEPRGGRAGEDVPLWTAPLSGAVVSGSMLVVHLALRACEREVDEVVLAFLLRAVVERASPRGVCTRAFP